MIKKITYIILFLSSFSLFASDPVSTAKMIGVLMSQLKELKEVLDVSSKTFDEIEAMNRKVQDNRFRILRLQNIAETAMAMQKNTYRGIEGTTSLIRRTKNLAKDSKGLGDEFYNELKDEEIDKVVEELEKLDSEYKELSERITILKRERAVLTAKVGATVKQADIEVGLRSELQSKYLETQSLDMPISPSSAQTLTAKNTALSNKINIQNSKLLSQSLQMQQGLLDHVKKEEINRLKNEESRKKLWGIKK